MNKTIPVKCYIGLFLIYLEMFIIYGVIGFGKRMFDIHEIIPALETLRTIDSVKTLGLTPKKVLLLIGYCLAGPIIISCLFLGFEMMLQKRKKGWHILPFVFSLWLVWLVYEFYALLTQPANRGFFSNITGFYEENYANPAYAKIKFSSKKNLVIVKLESFEDSFRRTDLFGENLIPNMVRRQTEDFSVAGYTSTSGYSNTLAGMVGILCGIPMVSRGEEAGHALPNAKCIPEILRDNGYKTLFVNGFWKKVFEYDTFLKPRFDITIHLEEITAKIPLTPEINYGGAIEDEAMLEYLKAEILELKNNSENYMVMVETVNTHCTEGFLSQSCAKKGMKKDRYNDVVKCSDSVVTDFIEYLQFLDPNVVVAAIADHKTMGDYFSSTPLAKLDRPLVNFITVETTARRDRAAVAADFMPTLMEAVGATVRGHRLGLGTSLLSDEETLSEELGLDKLTELMTAPNGLYSYLTGFTHE